MITSSNFTKMFKNNQRIGQEIFPELIKKLIISSANENITSLRFPSRDSIWAPGFDGHVTGNKVLSRHLPLGDSIWELGTSASYKSKIKSDYKKRTEEAVFFEKDEYTFILCTPFIFDGNLLSFENEIKQDRVWKDVRVYDAEIITDWLNENYEIILWLYGKFGKVTQNLEIYRADNVLTNYFESTTPRITDEIIRSSQNNNEGNQVEIFENNMKTNRRGVFTLFSPVSIEHGVLFSLSVLSGFISLFEKTIVVNDIESLKRVEEITSDKIILINFAWDGFGLTLNNNKYIFIVTDSGKNASQKLNNIRFDDFKRNLTTMGFKIGEADNITKKTNRNISSLIRRFANDPLLKMPLWARDANREVIIPLALMSSINKKYEGDLEVANELSGTITYIRDLEANLNVNDSPIFYFDNRYTINDKEEVLFTLDINHENSYVRKLEEIFKDIMKVPDVIYKQDKKNWDFRREAHKYSELLIRGIIESFIIIVIKDPDSEGHYDNLVKEVLDNALNSSETLNTTLTYLPLLAELSPNSVMSFIEESIDNKVELVIESIETSYGNGSFIKKSKFYDIKFAIDKCLSQKVTSIRALTLIFNLYNSNYRLPENFNIKDYAVNSFAPISSYYIPMSPRDKFDILKNLITEKNKLKSLVVMESFILGTNLNFVISSPIFKYREHPQISEDVSMFDHELNIDAIRFLLKKQDDRLELYVKLIDHITYFDNDTISLLFNRLESDIKVYDDLNKSEVNYIILKKIYSIRKYYNEEIKNHWFYLHKYLNDFIRLYDISLPDDIFYKFRYILVNSIYDIPYLDPLPYYKLEETSNYYSVTDEKRQAIYNNAFNELSKIDDNIRSEKIIKEIIDEGHLGSLLSSISVDKIKDIKIIIKNNKKRLLWGFIHKIEIDELQIIFKTLTSKERKFLVESLGQNKMAYLLVKDTDYEKDYWEKFLTFLESSDASENEIYIENLLKYNPVALINHYSYNAKITNEERLVLLESIVQNYNSSNFSTSNIYGIRDIVKYLDDSYYSEKLVILELFFLPLLVDVSNDYPKALKRYFFENPLMLIDYLKNCKPRDLNSNSSCSIIIKDILFPMNTHTIIPIDEIKNELEYKYTKKSNDENINIHQTKIEKWFNIIYDQLSVMSNQEDIELIERFLVLVLARIFSYKVGSESDYIIASLLEKLGENKKNEEKKDLARLFYNVKFNSFGVRTVDDGSMDYRLSENFLKLSKKYQYEYLIISDALKMLSDTFKSISRKRKNDQILGDSLYF